MERVIFDRLTEGARKAFAFARSEALRYGDKYIATFHIVLGLASSSKEVRSVLDSFNIDLGGLRRAVENITGRESWPMLFIGTVPFTAAAKESIERAGQASELMGEYRIGEIQLLLGLLLQRHGVAAVVLTKNWERGVEKVFGQILKSRGIQGDQAHLIKTLRNIWDYSQPSEDGSQAERNNGTMPYCGLACALSVLVAEIVYFMPEVSLSTRLATVTFALIVVWVVLVAFYIRKAILAWVKNAGE